MADSIKSKEQGHLAQVPETTGKPRFKGWLLLSGAALAGVVIGILLLATVLAGEIYDYQDTVDGTHLPSVDAIVVLAGGRGRISAAGDLWYRYWEKVYRPQLPGTPVEGRVPILYISGMGHQANWGVFTRQVRRGVQEVIRPDDVVLEHESENTEENAIWLARYARTHMWHRVILVTSSYHMKRSRMVFEKVLRANKTPVTVETLSIFQEPFEPSEWRTSLNGYRITMLEYIKGIYYHTMWNPSPVQIQ